MPDISMCIDQLCPIKEQCYRYTAIPSGSWQSYFGERVLNIAKLENLTENAHEELCDYYWSNETKNAVEKK